MKLPKCIGYRVEVLSGSCWINPLRFDDGPRRFDGVPRRSYCYQITRDCGHIHRTEAAAERCRQKLYHYNKERNTCSAAWYNAQVSRVYKGYEDSHLAI